MVRSIAIVVALLVGAVSAQATTLDFSEAGSGNLNQKSLHLDAGSVYSGADSLYVGAGGIDGSICALSTSNWNCANDLYIGFQAPVTDLSFDVGGYGYGDFVKVSVFDGAGDFTDRFNIHRGGSFDLSGYGSISGLFFDDRSRASGVSYGNFDYVAAVPLPASLPLLLAGIAGLGFARRKRDAA